MKSNTSNLEHLRDKFWKLYSLSRSFFIVLVNSEPQFVLSENYFSTNIVYASNTTFLCVLLWKKLDDSHTITSCYDLSSHWHYCQHVSVCLVLFSLLSNSKITLSHVSNVLHYDARSIYFSAASDKTQSFLLQNTFQGAIHLPKMRLGVRSCVHHVIELGKQLML